MDKDCDKKEKKKVVKVCTVFKFTVKRKVKKIVFWP